MLARRGAGGAGVALLLLAQSAQALDPPPPPAARADLPARLADHDTADGRFDGDLGLVFGLGATFSGSDPRGAADLRLRYLETAGIFASYEESFGAGPPNPPRLVALGLEMRPLFLARWVTGTDFGLAWPDLALDSLGLELGAVFEPSGGPFSRPGLQVSLGLELPLLAKTTGPWLALHGGGRFTEASLGGVSIPRGSEAFLEITVAWHQTIATHLVDVNDVAP